MSDFLGFRFGNTHTKDLHLTVVSSSNRYSKNLLPGPTDYTDDVPGGNGKWYYGQLFRTREFTVNVAFDDLDEQTWRRISQIFANDKPQDLVFDENPYKTYKAKLKSAPDFKYVCFKDRKTGMRVYKGEGTFNFICYHPLAYCFNKYVVRAADYYKCTMPENIINKDTINQSEYSKVEKPKMLNGLIKDHYNVHQNMNTPWKGGYPTIEQVQWGELYFTTDEEKPLMDTSCNDDTPTRNAATTKKLIIDVRGYWDNIPKWQSTAKLLTTPTLDFDQELIYMPQYSRLNYYNMDTGLNTQNGLIGSRILVYNPGDVSVPFELRLGNLDLYFRNLNRGEKKPYRFRISRYDVQRLSIEEAVDYTGLKTRNRDDNEQYKYGNRYVDILEGLELNDDNKLEPKYHDLKNAHPHHMYMVEPIPKEKLGDFIRLFYWQSQTLKDKFGEYTPDWERGKEIANRYEELYSQCITDEERYQLYWETLDVAILSQYNALPIFSQTQSAAATQNYGTIDELKHNWYFNPPEYIRDHEDSYYGEFNFNIGRLPGYYTYDYLDINSTGFEDIGSKEEGPRDTALPLFIDFDTRMLYNINEPEINSEDEQLKHNFYNFKPTKQVFNDNIERGHWFQLPPGWSLIDISPIVDEDIWGGKRWLDARPFEWGTTSTTLREDYNDVYEAAAREYISQACPDWELRNDTYSAEIEASEDLEVAIPEGAAADEVNSALSSVSREGLENYLQFRKWYGGIPKAPDKGTYNYFLYELQRSRAEYAEYGFLKLLATYWNVWAKDKKSYTGDVRDWWWYANSYIWHNFPPLYWGYADLLNKLQIKYVPEYY